MECEEKLTHGAYNISKRAFRGRGPEFLALQHGFMVHETLPSPTNPMAGLMPPCNNHCGSNYNSTPDTVASLQTLVPQLGVAQEELAQHADRGHAVAENFVMEALE
ncbi:MAG: hypothetical protein RIS76_1400 [Verrucomicrobiota bacterium]